MSDLFENHSVGFLKTRLICYNVNATVVKTNKVEFYMSMAGNFYLAEQCTNLSSGSTFSCCPVLLFFLFEEVEGAYWFGSLSVCVQCESYAYTRSRTIKS